MNISFAFLALLVLIFVVVLSRSIRIIPQARAGIVEILWHLFLLLQKLNGQSKSHRLI